MRHRRKVKKFKSGKDANKMLFRKLTRNFLSRGTIVTSLKKAKVLKSEIEKSVQKAKKNTQASRNVLLKKIADKRIIDILSKQVVPVFTDVSSGFVRLIKLGQRASDGTEMVKVEWTKPVVLNGKKPEKKSDTSDTEVKKSKSK
ncbi:hypothetical protein HYT33_02160 [Candidatus Roizmanbacteria bacterium]|nr:hypothetical protein [Candidatus Roizmanbacteria bacterium]